GGDGRRRGDRYALCDHSGGASLLVAVIAWDTEDLAAGFVRAYARVMLTKHGLTPAPPDVPLVAWSRGSSTFAIERHGRTVLLLEGVPTSALDALRTAVWARPVLY
ncbi:MAG TPA: hypothetical protein VHQ69_07750, partial [Methylomirabilota bacterium]|nr:hypothetical protein [Methylomirabilota bacterium]